MIISLLLNLAALVWLLIARMGRNQLNRDIDKLVLKVAGLNSENMDLSDKLRRYEGTWQAWLVQDAIDKEIARRLRARDIADIEHGMGG